MNKNTVVICLMLFISGVVLSLSNRAFAMDNYDIYLQVHSFRWEEFANGDQLLEESGPIYALGGLAMLENNSLTFRARGELFAGIITYDGQTQAGAPVETDTEYIGVKFEGDLGWKKNILETAAIEPFVGIGIRAWDRDIQSTNNASGVNEKWTSSYARLGLRGDSAVSDQILVFAEVGVKFPFHNTNRVDVHDVTLKPKNKESGFAEVGFKWKKLKASFFYEGLRFDESDVEPIGAGIGIYQPESQADIFGVNAGYSF